MKKIILAAVFCFFASSSYGMSFSYNGFECVGSQSVGTIPKQSKINVIENLGNGAYSITVTGGLPLFSYKSGPCIGSDFGVQTKDTVMIAEESAKGIAYFTGTHLIITLTILQSYGAGKVISGDLIQSGIVLPTTYTWIFDFIQTPVSLRLIRNIEIQGWVSSIGSALNGDVIDVITLNDPITSKSPNNSIVFTLDQ